MSEKKCYIFLWILFQCVDSNVWDTKPQQLLHLPGLNGRWWTMRWRPPPGLNVTEIQYSYVMNFNYNPQFKGFNIFIQGRMQKDVNTCSGQDAYVYPTETLGIWKYIAPNAPVNEYELMYVKTDYRTYLIELSCKPRFQKGCGLMAAVRTRVPFANPKLRHYLDKITEKALCMTPGDFLYMQGLSRSFQACPGIRKRKKKYY